MLYKISSELAEKLLKRTETANYSQDVYIYGIELPGMVLYATYFFRRLSCGNIQELLSGNSRGVFIHRVNDRHSGEGELWEYYLLHSRICRRLYFDSCAIAS